MLNRWAWDFDRAAAHEALARAHAVAGEHKEALRQAAEARRIGETLEDQEDREILMADLDTLPGFAGRGA